MLVSPPVLPLVLWLVPPLRVAVNASEATFALAWIELPAHWGLAIGGASGLILRGAAAAFCGAGLDLLRALFEVPFVTPPAAPPVLPPPVLPPAPLTVLLLALLSPGPRLPLPLSPAWPSSLLMGTGMLDLDLLLSDILL